MAREVIILDQIGLPSDVSYNVAYWLAVPAARQPFMANATATSRVVGATVAELTAIQNGSIHEVVETVPNKAGTSLATVQTQAQARFAVLQAALTANNPWNHYGTTWDGTSWTLVTVA